MASLEQLFADSTAGFNGFDWLVFAVVVLSMLFGFWRGFAREAMSLLGWVSAFVGANLLAQSLANSLHGVTDNPTFRYLLAWVLVFVGVTVIFGALGRVFSKQLRQPGFNLGNRLLGALFGVGRGLVMMMALALVLKGVLPDSEEAWLREARTMAILDQMADWFSENFDDLLQQQPAESLQEPAEQLQERYESTEML